MSVTLGREKANLLGFGCYLLGEDVGVPHYCGAVCTNCALMWIISRACCWAPATSQQF